MAKFDLSNRIDSIQKNPSAVKSVLKTFGNLGTDILKDYVPAGELIVTSNKDAINNIKNFKIKPPKPGNFKNGLIWQTSKKFLKNAIEDLKTGNFDNKDRLKAAEDDMLKNMGFDLSDDFWDNLDFGEDGSYTETSEDTESRANVDIHNIKTTNVMISNSNIKPILKSISNLTRSVIETNARSFSIINSKVSSIVTFNTETKIEFYNSMSSQLSEINQSVTKIGTIMEQLAHVEVTGLETTNKYNHLNTVLGSAELLNVKYYTDRLGIKKLANPVMKMLKGGIKMLLPDVLKDTLAEANDILKILPAAINQKFKNMKDSDGLGSFIGSIFYRSPSKSKAYEKGPVAFDGITRRAIVNVIPSLLAKILNTVQKGKPGDELVYDYEAGGFRKQGDIKRAAKTQAKNYVNDQIYEGSDTMNFLKKIKNNNTLTNNETKEVKRAIENLIMNKEMPRKGYKASKNEKVNKMILEAWQNMSTTEKAGFLKVISMSKSPEDFLLENESFHNVDDIFGYSDIFRLEETDKGTREKIVQYLYGKGYNKLANAISNGDPTRRNPNNLSRLNPLYYVVEGVRKGNDFMSRILFGDPNDKIIDDNSVFGKVRNKTTKIMDSVFKKPLKDVQKIIENDNKSSELMDELAEHGLGDAFSDFFQTIGVSIKGGAKNAVKGVFGTIHEKLIAPVTNVVNTYVVDPLKRGIKSVTHSIGNFFRSLADPFVKAYKKRKGIIEAENQQGFGVVDTSNEPKPAASKVDDTSNITKEMKQNENSVAKTVKNKAKSFAKMGKIERLITSKNLEIITALRQHISKPLEKLAKTIINTANIGLYNDSGSDIIKVKQSTKIIKNIDKNVAKLTKRFKENESTKKVQEIMDQYGVDKEEALEMLEKMEEEKRRKKQQAKDEKKAIKQQKKENKRLKYMSKLERINEMYNDIKDSKGEIVIDSLVRIKDKTVGKLGKITTRIAKNIGKIAEDIGATAGTIVGSVKSVISTFAKNAMDYITNDLPVALKSVWKNVKDVTKQVFKSVKGVLSEGWKEFKEQTIKIAGIAGSLFSGGLNRIAEMMNRLRQKKINVYVEGGYLDNINEVVRVVKVDKAGYEKMKAMFAAEDAEDAKDEEENKDDADTAKTTIATRIKERLELVGNLIKNTVGKLASGLVSKAGGALATGAGFLMGKIGGTAIGKLFKGAGNLVSKIGNKLSQRKSKGAKVIGKILNVGGDAAANSAYGNATPVYVVGGSLDGGIFGGDGDGDSIVGDAIEDAIDDKIEGKLGKKLKNSKISKKISKSKLGKSKLGRKIFGSLDDIDNVIDVVDNIDDVADVTKNVKNVAKGVDTATDVVKGVKNAANAVDTATDVVKGAKTAANVAKAVKAADTASDVVKGAKTAKGALTALKGVKSAKGLLTAAKGITAIGSAGGAAAAGGSILATGGAILAPLALAWLGDRALKGIGGFFNAGEAFGVDNPTLGMRASNALGTFLDGILPGDQSKWTHSIYNFGGKVKNGLKNFGSKLGQAGKKLFSLTPMGIGMNLAKKIKEGSDGKELANGLLQGKSSILTSLLTVTNPIAALSYKQIKSYREFKNQEKDLETKFLNKLTPAEREDYLANKNASVFGSMLRTQDGGKLVKTIMTSALLSTVGGAGAFGVKQLLDAISNAKGSASSNTQSVDPSTQNSGSVIGSPGNFPGMVSAKYETGSSDMSVAAAKIGRTAGDAGGASYGMSQFTTNQGSAKSFVQWLQSSGSKFGSYFNNAGSPGSASFDAAWKNAAAADALGFGQAQSTYTINTMVTPFNEKSKTKLGIDWYRDRGLQEAAYSTVVQFGQGGAMTVAEKAGISGSMSNTDIIKKFYAEKRASVGTYKFLGCSSSVRKSVYDRFTREEQDVLAYVGQPAVTAASTATTTATTPEPQTLSLAAGLSKLSSNVNTSGQKYSTMSETINTINNSTLADVDPVIPLFTTALDILTKIADNTKEVAEKDVVTEYAEQTTANNNPFNNAKKLDIGTDRLDKNIIRLAGSIA